MVSTGSSPVKVVPGHKSYSDLFSQSLPVGGKGGARPRVFCQQDRINFLRTAAPNHIKDLSVKLTFSRTTGAIDRLVVLQALEAQGIPEIDVVSVGPLGKNSQWTLVCRDRAVKLKLLAANLSVRGKQVQVEAVSKQDTRVCVHWLPPWVPDDVITEALAPFGDVVSHNFGSSNMDRYRDVLTHVRNIVVKCHEGKTLPPLVNCIYDNEPQQMFLVIPGAPVACFHCGARGHLQRDCTACRKCKSQDHTYEDCPEVRRLQREYADRVRNTESVIHNAQEDLSVQQSAAADLDEAIANIDSSQPGDNSQTVQQPVPPGLDKTISTMDSSQPADNSQTMDSSQTVPKKHALSYDMTTTDMMEIADSASQSLTPVQSLTPAQRAPRRPRKKKKDSSTRSRDRSRSVASLPGKREKFEDDIPLDQYFKYKHHVMVGEESNADSELSFSDSPVNAHDHPPNH
jgi:hypothetical protein